MKIHPLTICREKLQNNNNFITNNYKKVEMLEEIIAEEEILKDYALYIMRLVIRFLLVTM